MTLRVMGVVVVAEDAEDAGKKTSTNNSYTYHSREILLAIRKS